MRHPIAFVCNHVGEPHGQSEQMNLSTLAVVRSLGRKGIDVILITTNTSDAVIRSRYVKNVELCPYIYEPSDLMDRFFAGLASRYPGQKVLIPSVDEFAWYVGKNYSLLSRDFLIPAPGEDAMAKINNKRFQYEAASALGIPIPETYFPNTLEDVHLLSDRIQNYPYVIKPNISFEWKLKTAKMTAKGKKGIRVNSAAELNSIAQKIFTPGQEFMIQEVIGGRDHRLVTFLGFIDNDHKPNSWFIRKKIRQSPIDFGYCTMTESCHNPDVFKQSIQLLESIGYYGIAGVEWKLDPITNTYKLIEINGRPVNTTGCAMAAGVDLPAIAYFSAINRPLDPVTDWVDGNKWVWLAMDFWAARELAAAGDCSTWQWLKEISGAKADAVFSWDDLSISIHYYGKFIKSLVVDKFKKIKKPGFRLENTKNSN